MGKKVFLLLFLALIGCGYFGWQYYENSQVFRYAGTLETTKVIISSKVASDIVEFPVEEGDFLHKGDKILTMSCDVYKVMQKQLDNDLERAKVLLKKNFMSEAEYDVKERNKADNDLHLEWCQVKAPIDGTVITKFRENGEVVGVGSSLISMADMSDIWAYFYVAHDDVYRLKVGQKVIGILPEDNNKKFVGKIIKINEEAEFTPKNVQTREERTRLVYGIKVKFENPDLILKSGMTIESTLFDE